MKELLSVGRNTHLLNDGNEFIPYSEVVLIFGEKSYRSEEGGLVGFIENKTCRFVADKKTLKHLISDIQEMIAQLEAIEKEFENI